MNDLAKKSVPPDWKPLATYLVVAAVLGWWFVAKMTVGLWFSDLYGHLKVTYGVLTHQIGWPAHIGFYALTATVAGFSTKLATLKQAGTMVMAVAVAAKVGITWVQGLRLAGARLNPWLWVLACVVLNFGFSIPNPWLHPWSGQYYIGNIPPNVWHNSTTMLLMPFAMMQFVAACRWLEHGARVELVKMLIWGLLAVLVKPSYLIAFLPAFSLMALWRWRLSRPLLEAAVACAVLAAVLLMQKSLLSSDGSMASVELGWLDIWRNYHAGTRWPDASIAVSFALSLALPVAVLLWRPELRRDWLVRFGLVQFGVALLVSMVLHESGPRMVHGNLAWQVVICCFLLYWVIAIRSLARLDGTTVPGRGWQVVAALALLHGVSGLVYLVRAIVVYTFI